MGKIIYPNQSYLGVILFFLIFIIVFASPVFAQDFESKTGQNLIVSTAVLSITAKVSSEQMSISYNGLSSGSGLLFQSDKKTYDVESSDLSDAALNGFDEENTAFKFYRKLKHMTHYFLKYFNVDGFSGEDNSKFLLKGKVDTNPVNPDDFEFNLSFNVGYDNDTILKMNAVKLESYWRHTFVNAVYHPEKEEFELGMSSVYINNYLLDGMKLEFQANPSTRSGAILFTINL